MEVSAGSAGLENSGTAKPLRPRLVAIVHLDMVSYSRLIGLDVTGTLLRLRAFRSGLIDPLLDQHYGRLVQTGGDSLLLTFDSVMSAVAFAVALQRAVPEHDGGSPIDRRIRFRVGIDVGDVIPDGTDLHGNNVNIAVRLQTACPAGGICVSRAVHDHVRDQAPVPFSRLGTLSLKNILHPIEAFSWHPDSEKDASGSAIGPDSAVPAPAMPQARPMPFGPSIAILPFRMVPARAEDAYFADGIVEDIIHMLAAQKELFVISRGSSMLFSQPDIDTRLIASELGVRYLLHGTVRRAADRLRIRTELTDTETAGVIRSDQYDGVPDDLFDLQESIAIRVAATIAPQVRERELRRAMRKPPSSLTAYDLVLQALDQLYRFDNASFVRARDFLERAIALDPDYGPAHGYLAYWYIFHVGEGRSRDPDADARAAAGAAAAAIERDTNDALALAIYGHVQSFLLHDYDQGLHYLDRALAAGPNCAMAWTMSSAIRGYLDQGAEAVRHAQRGLLLSPLDAHIFWHEGLLAQALYINGQYEDAVAMAGRGARRNPSVMFNLRVLIASQVAAGAAEDARQNAARLMRALPDFRLSDYAPRCPFRGATLTAWIARLRQAGVRD